MAPHRISAVHNQLLNFGVPPKVLIGLKIIKLVRFVYSFCSFLGVAIQETLRNHENSWFDTPILSQITHHIPELPEVLE
jgi:hypothetical protein